MNMRAVAFGSVLVLVVSGLVACSGGGVSNNSPVMAPAAPPAGNSGTLTLTVPRNTASAKRSPQYVSPNSAALVTTVKSVNGQPPTSTQVPQNPKTVALSTGPGGNCTTAPTGETCAIGIATPSGTVVYQFDLLDASSNILSTNTLTFQIAVGSSPNLQAQLDGVVATVSIFTPTLTAGTSFSGPITVQAFDLSGALIVGAAPYAYAFKLTDNDATVHTSLTVNGNTGKTVTVTSPNDVVILNYDGQHVPSFTVTAATVNGPHPISGGTTVAGT